MIRATVFLVLTTVAAIAGTLTVLLRNIILRFTTFAVTLKTCRTDPLWSHALLLTLRSQRD
jgi:hypothetical protein